MTGSIVIFGGSGFIGTHLIRKLISKGETRILSIDLRPLREINAEVNSVIADVRDLSSLNIPEDTKCIYNLAAVHTTPGHPEHEYYETNILGAMEICRLANRHNVKEIVFTSSISVYGPGEEMKSEETPTAPKSAYGFSKRIAEEVHRHWLQNDQDRRLTIARPAVVFGPGEGGNFTRMASLLKKGIFLYPGRSDTIKACIYVEDLVDAIEFARQQPGPMVLFNGAYPQRYTIKQIVDIFSSRYFPKVVTLKIPLAAVICFASILRAFDKFNMGIHPDRVVKLVRSTDIYPAWLVKQGKSYPDALELALAKWCRETNGAFN